MNCFYPKAHDENYFILSFFFLTRNTDLLRIFAVPFANNVASCRILEKAGFVLEGTLRKNAFKNGKVLDMKMYALVKV